MSGQGICCTHSTQTITHFNSIENQLHGDLTHLDKRIHKLCCVLPSGNGNNPPPC